MLNIVAHSNVPATAKTMAITHKPIVIVFGSSRRASSFQAEARTRPVAGTRRKDVRVEFETGDREEDQDQRDPHPQRPFYGGYGPACPPRIDRGGNEHEAPWEAAAEITADVKQQTAIARREGRWSREVIQVPAQHVVANKTSSERHRHVEKPWRGDEGHEEQAEIPAQAEHERPCVAAHGQRDAEQHGKDQRDRALRHHREGEQQPAHVLQATAARGRRDEQTADRAEKERRVEHVEDADAGECEGEGSRGEKQRRPIARRPAGKRLPDPAHGPDQADRGQRARQAQGKFILAEQRFCGCLQPVIEDWFVDEWNAFERRNQPLASTNHLPRELCVMRFVRVEKLT